MRTKQPTRKNKRFIEPVNPPTLDVPDYRTYEGSLHWKNAMQRNREQLVDTLKRAATRDRRRKKADGI